MLPGKGNCCKKFNYFLVRHIYDKSCNFLIITVYNLSTGNIFFFFLSYESKTEIHSFSILGIGVYGAILYCISEFSAYESFCVLGEYGKKLSEAVQKAHFFCRTLVIIIFLRELLFLYFFST